MTQVTQEDREAAAQWAKRQSRLLQAANMRRGGCDTAPLVQAFARHREQSQAELLEALEKVAAYNDGRGAFNFGAMPSFERENEAFDAWLKVRAEVDAAVAKARGEA